MFRFAVCFLLSSAAIVAGGTPTRIRRTTDGLTPSTDGVEYACSFDGSLWSAQRHPKDYPRGAHWSAPVVTTHSSAYSLWDVGAKASPGVEVVAETGVTNTLVRELNRADGVVDYEVLRSQGEMQWRANNVVGMNSTHNRISGISMIAPSPDWFSGFHDVTPVNEETGNWYYRFTMVTSPYDAGTERGETYSLSNPDQVPKRNIQKIRPANAPGGGIFVTQKAGSNPRIKKVAKWNCVQADGREDCQQYMPDTDRVNRCARRNRRKDNQN